MRPVELLRGLPQSPYPGSRSWWRACATAVCLAAALTGCSSADSNDGTTAVEDTASSDSAVAPLPDLVDVPAATGPEAVLGSPNAEAAAEVLQELEKVGFDLPGVSVHVYPIVGLGKSMLALDVDLSVAMAGQSSESPDMEKLWPAIVSAPAVKDDDITRFALYMHGTDDKGPYSLTMTMPMSAVQGMVDGTLSESDAQQQMLMKTERGAP